MWSKIITTGLRSHVSTISFHTAPGNSWETRSGEPVSPWPGSSPELHAGEPPADLGGPV